MPLGSPTQSRALITWCIALSTSGYLAGSVLARSINLRITIPLINKLRSLARKQNGDGLAVMCGGASTDAAWSPAGPMKHSHIFWECSFFPHLRVLGPPRCPLSQRLGWGPVRNGHHDQDREQTALISQLSSIRRAQWKAKSSPLESCLGSVSWKYGPKNQGEQFLRSGSCRLDRLFQAWLCV